MRWLKQGPLLVWFQDTVALVPLTTGSVNVGGAAVSVQVGQRGKHNVYIHTLYLFQPAHMYIANSPCCIYVKATFPCLRLHGSEHLMWLNWDTNTKCIHSHMHVPPIIVCTSLFTLMTPFLLGALGSYSIYHATSKYGKGY